MYVCMYVYIYIYIYYIYRHERVPFRMAALALALFSSSISSKRSSCNVELHGASPTASLRADSPSFMRSLLGSCTRVRIQQRKHVPGPGFPNNQETCRGVVVVSKPRSRFSYPYPVLHVTYNWLAQLTQTP